MIRMSKLVAVAVAVLGLGAIGAAYGNPWDIGPTSNPGAVIAALSDGTLTIRGAGAMRNFGNTQNDRPPWWTTTETRDLVTTVVIEDGVTNIGNMAFWNHRYLTSVTIPNSVTAIGGGAFSYCWRLASITIPENVTSIGNNAFERLPLLTSITIPEKVQTIGNNAFDSTGLTSITIPNSVTSIGTQAFRNNRNLATVTIGSGVTVLQISAFQGCSSLTSITVSENNANFSSEDGVLFNKAKTSIMMFPWGKQGAYTIPSSITAIANNTFENRIRLTSVTIPNSVLTIGNSAFAGSGLTTVTIGSGVTLIGNNAFQNTDLNSVIIPNSVDSIGSRAFANCSSLVSVTIGESVRAIGMMAFESCINLTAVAIPNSVTTLGRDVFAGCTRLASVTLGRVLGDNMFVNNTALTSITIPDNVTKIARAAFQNTGLTSVIIPNSVDTIQWFAFYDTPLASVVIGSGVKWIGGNAFPATGFTSITNLNPVPPTIISSGHGDIFTSNVLQTATLYVPETAIEAYMSHEVWGLFANINPAPTSVAEINRVNPNSSLMPSVSVRGRTLNVKSSQTDNLQVRMIDMRGRTAANFKIVNGVDNSFSLTKMPAGRYIVEVRNAGGGRVSSMPVVIR